MFQTEKYNPSPLFNPFKKLPAPPLPATAKPFEEALAARLESLLPIPGGSGEIPLAWLSLLVDVLSRTLPDAAALISGPSVPISDRNALSSHLDDGIALLDACNAISAAADRLRRRRLLIRFALHLLSSSSAPDAAIRARDVIKEWEEEEEKDKESTEHAAADLIRKLRPSDQPRGKISAVRRAIYAVEALSSLVATAVLVTIGEGRGEDLTAIRVSGGDFSWAEPFNKVTAAVAGKLPARATEVLAVEATVRKLAVALDGDGEGKAERLKGAVEEAEKATEELTEGLERLSDGVSRLFRRGLNTRMSALQSFRITPKKCNQ